MLKGLFSRLRPEGNESVRPKQGATRVFHLMHDNVTIATLTYAWGRWRFEYAPGFSYQQKLTPLPEFPDVKKVYESEHLWATFAGRIPSITQPAIRDVIASESLDSTDELALLARFGGKTVSSPFELRDSGPVRAC